jgi:hypothetical protein
VHADNPLPAKDNSSNTSLVEPALPPQFSTSSSANTSLPEPKREKQGEKTPKQIITAASHPIQKKNKKKKQIIQHGLQTPLLQNSR